MVGHYFIKSLILLTVLIFAVFNQSQIANCQDQMQWPDINIININDSQEVNGSFGVIGTISGDLPENTYMWLIVSENITNVQGRPQGREGIVPYNGQWYEDVLVDAPGTAIGRNFDIYVILVNKEDNDKIKGNQNGSIPIPENKHIACKKTVVRVMSI